MTRREWLMHRLRAMSISEILWRIQQKLVYRWEYSTLYQKNLPVWKFKEGREQVPARGQELIPLSPDEVRSRTIFTEMALPGGYSYSEYKEKWNAGYQTGKLWPEEAFSPGIPIAGREEIGDIRTNWELNRHLQFPCLAKNYLITGKTEDFEELDHLFRDWNRHNAFLHGVEWNSPMEIAIRTVNWTFTAGFLEKAAEEGKASSAVILTDQLKQGIRVMAESVLRHRSHGSSANNHLIVELSAIGIAGIYLKNENWIERAVKELTRELSRQFHADGINREMSLHYQAFAMEAYGLYGILLQHSGRKVPDAWQQTLGPASEFLRSCCGNYGEALDFGDNDEGRILDLTGNREAYYAYVLQLMGIIMNRRYIEGELCETVCWLTDREDQQNYIRNECRCPSLVGEYPEGGYTILRSTDGRLLLGFDHGPLGYGALAAHGHADALSIQVFYDGRPLLGDPGTGSYHVPKKLRNPMRSTENHNTVKIEGIEQALMLGPFLWGKRYQLLNTEMKKTDRGITLRAGITYEGICHYRTLHFDYKKQIVVEDMITGTDHSSWQCWCIPHSNSFSDGNVKVTFQTDSVAQTEEIIPYSPGYNRLEEAESLRYCLKDGKIRTVITVKE